MQVQYTDAFMARLWSRVNKNGPIPAHRPELAPCWVSSSSPTKHGYARMGLNYALVYVHRVVYEVEIGPIPAGMGVLHHCDNPPCCRPSHLFAGTQLDNMRDAKAKDRHAAGNRHGLRLNPSLAARGDRNGSRTHPERFIGRPRRPFTVRPERVRRGQDKPQAILTDADVREIRRAFHAREATQVALAARFNVTQTNISCIVRGKTWKHLL